MAIWNYRYYLIPSAAIRNKFNANKDIILDEYRSNGFQNFNENKSFENYFIDNDAEFIQKTIDWAIKYNCLLVIGKTGNIVSPNINNLIYEIKAYLESKPWPI